MTVPSPAPLWRGRALALVTIVLVALNLRTAVAALSPIFDEIGQDVALGSIGIGFLGTLPPICFAVMGLLAPALHRRFGLEPVVVGALLAIVLGDVVRGLAVSYPMLAIGSAVTFGGMGVANILLPPLVKAYFPDRIGLLTSVYATTLALGATIPPLVAVPVADSLGWRVSVGMWAVLALVALTPLLMLTARAGRARRAERDDALDATRTGEHARGDRDPAADDDLDLEEPQPAVLGRVWRSPLAWALMLMFAMTALNTYAMFAWLPSILIDIADATPGEAGLLLSLYSVMGLPASLIIPVLAVRMRNVGVLISTGVVLFVVGYGGLLLVPGQATWLWVILIGLGPLLFPLALVLINLRTRTHVGAVALSSFVQSFGYAVGALGPLLVGVLHQLTGDWIGPLLFLLGTSAVVAVVGIVVARPRMLEDQWHN